MIEGKKVLAVVPARGGSKGVPLKNIRPLEGVPLVARVGAVVAELSWIDRAVVSTDHEEIARIAEEAGLAAPFRRPEEISGDRIGDVDVLLHALEASEALDNVRYDIVLMLQPTSPMRTAAQVEGTVRMMLDDGYDAVWTVAETDSKGHPLKQLTIQNGQMDYYDQAGANIIARQQLTPVYHRNGVAYALKRELLTEARSLKSNNTGAYVIDEFQISIDTELDFELAEFFLEKRKEQAAF